jgi:hypothetical protein
MKSFFAALRSLVLPFGATSGPRIVLDGVNGRIQIISPSGSQITEFADANFAEIDLQPPDTATPGTSFGVARIFTSSAGDIPVLDIKAPTSTVGVFTSPGPILLDGPVQWGSAAVGTATAKDVAVTTGTTSSVAFTNNLAVSGITGIAFVMPPSGKVFVLGETGGYNNTATGFTLVSLELRIGSTVGAGIVVFPSDENSASQFQSTLANAPGQHSVSDTMSGFIAGNNFNVCLTFRVTNAAHIGNFNRGKISVIPTI